MAHEEIEVENKHLWWMIKELRKDGSNLRASKEALGLEVSRLETAAKVVEERAESGGGVGSLNGGGGEGGQVALARLHRHPC